MVSTSHKKGGTQRSPVVIALLLSLALLSYGESVFITLTFSGFLFVILDPMVDKLNQYRLPRRFGAPIAVFLALCLIGLVSFSFYESILKLMGQLPSYSQKLTSLASHLHAFFQRILYRTHALLQGANNFQNDQSSFNLSSESASALNGFILKGFNSAMGLVTFVVFIPLLTLFMLIEKDFLQVRMAAVFKNHHTYEKISTEVRQMTRGFFLGNFVVGSVMSMMFVIVFLLLHLKNPFPLALFAGFLNIIPVLGTVLGAVLPCIQAFLQFDDMTAFFIILAATGGIHFIGNNIIIPKFVGSKVNINATAATIGFLIFGSLWGGIGLFLSTPILASLRIVLAPFERTRAIANLIGKTPVPSHRKMYSVNPIKPHHYHTPVHRSAAEARGKHQ